MGRDGGAVTATDQQGVLHVPVAALTVLMVGPGTRVTHQAITAIADAGCSVVWVGEEGIRYYAHGQPIARSDRLLMLQAQKVANARSRLDVARRMYAMRFPDDNVEHLTMQQLRGKEGARVRGIYRRYSKLTGVAWQRRSYDPGEFSTADPINRALSTANACLYGVCHAAITAVGCSPGLGFVHTGNDRSFVYDIADLYKAETSIPVAFDAVAAAERSGDFNALSRNVRYAMRDRFHATRLVEQVVEDIKSLLLDGSDEDERYWDNVVHLWDGKSQVPAGTNYAEGEQPDDPQPRQGSGTTLEEAGNTENAAQGRSS